MTIQGGNGSGLGKRGGTIERMRPDAGPTKRGRRTNQRRQPQQQDPADEKAERFFLLAFKLLAMSAEATRRGDLAEAERRLQEALSVAEQMPEGRSGRRLRNRVRQRAREVQQGGRARKALITKAPPKSVMPAPAKGTRNPAKQPAQVLVQRHMKKVQRCSVCGIADPSLPKSKKDRICVQCRREQRGVFLLQAGSPGLGRRGR